MITSQSIAVLRRARRLARTRIIPDPGRAAASAHPQICAGYTDKIFDGAWKGHRAFVVGGGPSLRGFNFRDLRGERIIAVNRAFEYLPFAEILFSMDFRYYQEVIQTSEFKTFRGRKIWIDTRAFPYRGVETIKMNVTDLMSPSIAKGISTGSNSGYAALNLAVLLGADPIYLLGFDFKTQDRRSHFHPGYRFIYHAEKLERWRKTLDQAGAGILAAGRKVINLSSDSALTVFPFGKFEEIVPRDDFLVVSYYTDGYYRVLADRLKASCDHFQIRHDIRPVESRGNWTENTGIRAEFLRDMMDAHPGENLVWIDADAIVQRYPILFHELPDVEIAAHYLQRRDGNRKELLGGTMFLRPTANVRAMMDEWIQESRRLTYYKDQLALRNIIDRNPGRFVVRDLPPTYCQIFDTMRACGNPVIEHFQASRTVRKKERMPR